MPCWARGRPPASPRSSVAAATTRTPRRRVRPPTTGVRGSTTSAIHQPGITTPAPEHAVLAGFGTTATSADELRDLLQALADETDALTSRTIPQSTNDLLPPPDNGILGYTAEPDDLTITVALGASLFDDRFGLASRQPAQLVRMPVFPNDEPHPDQSHGDLLLQICGGTEDTVTHALRRLMRVTRASLTLRWMAERLRPAEHADRRAGVDAQPARVQGRHGQPVAERRCADGRARLGARRRCRAGVGRRRELPGGADHPQPRRVLGPHRAEDPGADHRAQQGGRRAARRPAGDRHPRSSTRIPTAR